MLRSHQYLAVLLINSVFHTDAFGLFQGTDPKIVQDIVWVYSNSSSIDYTNTDITPIFYDENIGSVSSNNTQLSKTGLRGILYDRGDSCASFSSSATTNRSQISPTASALLPFPFQTSSTSERSIDRVALIKDGGPCSLNDKISNAELYDNASACIIFPSVVSQSFQTQIIALNSSITIPVLYVEYTTGQHLYSQLAVIANDTRILTFPNGPTSVTAKQAVRVLLLPYIPGTPNPWEISLMIMIIFLAIGFILSVILQTYLWRKNKRLHRMIESGLLPPTPDMLPMGKRLLDEVKLAQFPTKTVEKSEDNGNEARKHINKIKRLSRFTVDDSANHNRPLSTNLNAVNLDDLDEDACVICLEPLEVGQKVRQLPCQHEYHCHCIDPWLTSKSGECPLCKFDCVRHVTTSEDQKAIDELHAYYMDTDITVTQLIRRIVKRRFGRFMASSSPPTPQQAQSTTLTTFSRVTSVSATTPTATADSLPVSITQSRN